MTYDRRDPRIEDCTNPYIYEIVKYAEAPCAPANPGEACTWGAMFHLNIYNAVMPTYKWRTSLGVIQDDTAKEMQLFILSSSEEDFEVSCDVVCMVDGVEKTHSITQSFSTTLLEPKV